MFDPANPPQDVGLILSYRCTSRCAHCLYNCGPNWPRQAMRPEDVLLALRTLASWPSPPQVHLTGGEPFLFFDLLLGATQVAAELGLTVYVETGAAWCTDDDQTIERFYALRQSGLAAVLISCSPFHAARFAPEHTLRAVRAALTIFGPGQVLVYQPDYLETIQQFSVTHPTPLDSYEEYYSPAQLRHLFWDGYGLISGGRAGYKLGHLVECIPAKAFCDQDCSGEILFAQHSHMDLGGNYIPGFCAGLSAADWRKDANLLQRPYPPLVELLIEGGPYALYELARRRHNYRPLPAGYAGKCHLCVDLRWHLVRQCPEEYPELRPLDFYKNI